jgi:2-phospho-L-lactate guanylyltransferase
MIWALVPVKELAGSKQRLAPVLGPGERKDLVLAMLRDVLAAVRAVSEFEGVLLVTRSQEVSDLARKYVTDTFMESAGSDHSRAVTEANCYLVDKHRARCSMAISGDIPLVTARDIRRVIAGHDRVTLVSNESGEGTNAVVSTLPGAITYHFGRGSLKLHTDSAHDAGISPKVLRITNMALDIDEPQDLSDVLERLPSCFTRDFLQRSGIAARLHDMKPPPLGEPVCMQGVKN